MQYYIPNRPIKNWPFHDVDIPFPTQEYTIPAGLFGTICVTRPTDQYVYPVGTFQPWVFRDIEANPNSGFDLDPMIRDDILSGKAKLLIDCAPEGYSRDNWNWSSVFANIIDLKPEHLILLHSDVYLNTQYDIPTLYTPMWEIWSARTPTSRQIDYISDRNRSIMAKQERPFKALCLNRILREHRVALCKWIDENNHGSSIDYSFGLTKYGYSREESIEHIKEHLCPTTEPFADIIAWVRRHGEKNISTEQNGEVDLADNQLHTDEPVLDAFQNSYFSIVTETNFSKHDGVVFLSEKVFKPIRFMHPFIVVGSAGTVGHMRDLGYDVFDDFIDHSYDLIEDPYERMEALFQEIERLISIDHEAWRTMLQHSYLRLVKNLRLLERRGNTKLDITRPMYKGRELVWTWQK